ncbi:cyclic nucleotide-binding domain-containing protein [Pedobacter ureilyticus]|uniref:Crp/Fnr family transcriptional regulator n=1 Tax=Pedobacter ureilyticus TaxID=1393051 RepID=A0ABW9J931_9SPHI|nr:hypothetical protein [Pedobacter helvus]
MPQELLKLKLQSLGALRPEAWERIVRLSQQQQISDGGNFIRREGALAYVASGILKEYDQHEREIPAIVNFIGDNKCFVTRRHHQSHYLQACMPCIVYNWDFDDLQQIHRDFNELKHVYEALCAEYDAGVLLRMRLLEMTIPERIIEFKSLYSDILPYLKRKDIANYLHISYTYFLSIW